MLKIGSLIFKLKCLEHSLFLKSLGLPGVPSDGGGFSVPAGGASFIAHVVSASSAASAADVDSFALALAH
jgi:hypothetical protein